MKTNLKTWMSLAVLSALCSATSLRADGVFNFDLNTAGLDQTNEPYSLGFSYIYGGTSTLNNTATINNFSFSGTGAGGTGSSSPTGNASGDFTTGFTLQTGVTAGQRDGTFLNDINQAFTAGTTDIKFTVDLTQNTTGTVPDNFEIYLIDSQGNPVSIDDSGNLVDIPVESLQTFGAHPLDTSDIEIFAPANVPLTATPEPASWALGLIASTVFLLFRRQCRRSA